MMVELRTIFSYFFPRYCEILNSAGVSLSRFLRLPLQGDFVDPLVYMGPFHICDTIYTLFSPFLEILNGAFCGSF